MSTKRTTIGILALSTISLAGIFITPIIGLVAQAFPGASLSNIQMIVSVSTPTALVGAWGTGKLVQLLSRKTVAMIGVAGILIFGLLPLITHTNLTIVIALSSLMGICLGFINNTLPAFIPDHYDMEARHSMMGRQVAFASIGAMVFIYAAGMLGKISWYHAYLVYAFAAVILLIICFTLPRDKVSDAKGKSSKFSLTEAMTPKSGCWS